MPTVRCSGGTERHPRERSARRAHSQRVGALVDAVNMRGVLDVADRDLYEGTDESKRQAREATHRQSRLNLARGHGTWVELEADRIEPVGRWFVVDTSTGQIYRPVKLLSDLPSGAPQL